MSAAPRKVVAEITLTPETRERVSVGARTLYHYWPLLQAYYRGAFLAPQRRTDGNRVGFQWIQDESDGLPSADELKKLRRRLSDAHRDLVDAWADGVPGGSLSAEESELLRSRLGRVVANLVSLPDRELLGFVASTGDGLAVHSWGAEGPGVLTYPDEQVLAVRGRVRQGDAPVAGAVVNLEDEEGRSLEQTRADTSGFYGFYKLKPGRYRVKATSPKATFAAEGVGVELVRTSEEQVDLVAEDPAPKVDVLDTSESVRPATPSQARPTGSSRRLGAWLAVGLVVLAGVVAWFLWKSPSAAASREEAPVASSERVSKKPIQNAPPQAGPQAEARKTRSKAEQETEEEVSLRRTQARRPVSLSDEALYEAFERGELTAGAPSAGEPPDARGPTPESGLPGDVSGPPSADGQAIDSGAAGGPDTEPESTSSSGSTDPEGQMATSPGQGGPPADAGSVTAPPGSGGQPKAKTAAKKPSPPPRDSRPSPQPATKKPVGANTKVAKSPAPSSSQAPSSASSASDQSPTRSPEGSPPIDGTVSASSASRAASGGSQEDEVRPTPSPQGVSPGAATAEDIPEPWERWLPPVLAHLGRWQVRLFADAIVPTEPRVLGEPFDFSEARQAAWRQRQRERPAWLKQPRLLAGLKFHPPVAPRGGSWSWRERGARGGLLQEARGARPWLAWYGGAPSEAGQFTLTDAAGAEWVRVRVAATGEVSWQVREGVRVSYWLAVEGDAGATWKDWRWREEEGGGLPPAWVVDDWGAGRGQKLEVPLDEEVQSRGRVSIRFLDTRTLWGLGGEFVLSDRREPLKP